jgi:hypothetical protein
MWLTWTTPGSVGLFGAGADELWQPRPMQLTSVAAWVLFSGVN